MELHSKIATLEKENERLIKEVKLHAGKSLKKFMLDQKDASKQIATLEKRVKALREGLEIIKSLTFEGDIKVKARETLAQDDKLNPASHKATQDKGEG